MIDEFPAYIIVENVDHTIVFEAINVTPHENFAPERVYVNCFLHKKCSTQLDAKHL
jgi:hypothetical protein